MDEYVDIVDRNGERTGKTILKSEAHKNGDWHLATHMWIYNDKKQVLMQKRAKIKQLLPGLWDTAAAGHVFAGEKIIVSALRELEEELGIKEAKQNLEKIMFVKKGFTTDTGLINNEFQHIFLLKYNGGVNNLKLEEEEVEQVKWFDIDELSKILFDKEKKKDFVFPSYFQQYILELIKNRVNQI